MIYISVASIITVKKQTRVRLGYISTGFDPASDIEIDMDDVEFQDL